jgi:hypothetical protein
MTAVPAPKGNEYAKGNKGGGRKSVYRPEYAEQAAKLCEMGFTDQMLGGFFGVNESTINRWKLEHEEFLQALRVGKEVADDAVERAVFLSIIGFTRKEQKLVGSGEDAHVIEVEKYYPPQPGAGLKWLAVRRPEQYREKREPEETHTLHEGLRAAMEEMRERAMLRRAEQAKLANSPKLIEPEQTQ